MKRDDPEPPWRTLTRRAFVAMLGAAATMVLVRKPREPAPTTTPERATRWIGHC